MIQCIIIGIVDDEVSVNQQIVNVYICLLYTSTEKAYDLKEMHRVVNSLPKEYRVPFAMHVSGFKYREIAEKLNLTLGTIKRDVYKRQI